MPRPRRGRSGSLSMDTDGGDQLGSGYPGRPSSGNLRSSTTSSFGGLPGLPELPGFPASGQYGDGATSPFSPTSGDEDGHGPSHASRNIRKFSKRATFSTAQLGLMEDLWSQTEYPSNDQIERCAAATGLVSMHHLLYPYSHWHLLTNAVLLHYYPNIATEANQNMVG